MSACGRMSAANRWGVLAAFLAGWTIAVTTALGQQTRDSANPEGKWEVLEGCTLVTNMVVDGDSFQVQHKDRTYIFRLYFVDAPEADVSLQERIQDQAAYFGISMADIPRGGKLAAQFTRERLTGRQFTVVTRWQNAMGRSKLARFYCIALVKGENLAELLVANGWARIYGLRANWPDGTRSATVINKLKNLELTAREQRRGVWDEKSFSRIAAGADGATAKASGGKGSEKKITSGTVDVNEASVEELQRLPGIGPKLAEKIIANRPYHKVDDLLKVSGIGPKSIERFRALVRVEGAEGNEPVK